MWQQEVIKQTYAGTGKHAENIVQQVLEDTGYEERCFKELVKCYKGYGQKALAEAIYAGDIDVETGKYYFAQPCGSQSSPDFIIVDPDAGIQFVEVKASTKNLYEFNSHLVVPGYTYVFSSPQHDFAVKSGSEIMDPEVRKVIAETQQKMNDLVEEQMKRLEKLHNPQNWRLYPRGKINNSNIFAN
jgi:hypothetical protein